MFPVRPHCSPCPPARAGGPRPDPGPPTSRPTATARQQPAPRPTWVREWEPGGPDRLRCLPRESPARRAIARPRAGHPGGCGRMSSGCTGRPPVSRSRRWPARPGRHPAGRGRHPRHPDDRRPVRRAAGEQRLPQRVPVHRRAVAGRRPDIRAGGRLLLPRPQPGRVRRRVERLPDHQPPVLQRPDQPPRCRTGFVPRGDRRHPHRGLAQQRDRRRGKRGPQPLLRPVRPRRPAVRLPVLPPRPTR